MSAPSYEVGENGNKVYLYDDKFKGKWTLPDAGQSKYGGWTAAGVKRFVELKDLNREVRLKGKSMHAESHCLARLRQAYWDHRGG